MSNKEIEQKNPSSRANRRQEKLIPLALFVIVVIMAGLLVLTFAIALGLAGTS